MSYLKSLLEDRTVRLKGLYHPMTTTIINGSLLRLVYIKYVQPHTIHPSMSFLGTAESFSLPTAASRDVLSLLFDNVFAWFPLFR